MSDTRIPRPHASTPLSLITRRRLLPLASTAAVLGIAGCAMSGSTATNTPPDLAPAATSVPMTAQQRLANDLVRQYTDTLDVALDRVDRERIRAAAEKKNAVVPTTPPAPVAAVTPANTPGPATQPTLAAAPAPVNPPLAAAPIPTTPAASAVQAAEAQASVILASSASAEAETAHVAPGAESSAPAANAVAEHAAPGVAPTPPASPRTVSAASVVAAPVPVGPAATPLAIAKANSAEVGKPPAPAAPIVRSAAPVADVQATPVSTKAPSTAVITPITVVPSSSPTAMGAMTAVITPSVAEPAPAAPAALVASAATPVIAAQAPAAEPTLEDAMAVVRKRVSASPTFNTALAMALLDPADPHAADLARNLPEADQKVFADLLTALQGMNAAGNAATPADRAAPLVDVAKKWQADADLALPRLVLANRVDSFGVYNALEPRFEQGRKHTVIIYCEVANFSSKKGDDGWYQTRLAQQETLITDDGLLVWRPNAEEVEDRSMNQRHDFYLVKKLTIPENLAAGKYTLRMSVTDRNTNKISMVSLPIEILAK